MKVLERSIIQLLLLFYCGDNDKAILYMFFQFSLLGRGEVLGGGDSRKIDRKGTPLVQTLLTNGTNFTYLVGNFVSLSMQYI